MGFLAGAGEAVGAAGAGGSIFGTGAAATGFGVAGDVFQGIGGYQQAMFAAQIARQNAKQALIAGQDAGSASRMKYGALEAEQTTAYAANGISVDSGTPVAMKAGTEKLSDLDAMAIRFNASRQAYAENAQAALDKKAATGALLGGIFKGADTFLGGAQSLSSKFNAMKLSNPGGLNG